MASTFRSEAGVTKRLDRVLTETFYAISKIVAHTIFTRAVVWFFFCTRTRVDRVFAPRLFYEDGSLSVHSDRQKVIANGYGAAAGSFQLGQRVIELLVVNGRAIHRCGLKKLFAEEPDIRVMEDASNGMEALAKLREREFDVLVIDINTEARDGLRILESVRVDFPNLPILLLSVSRRARDVRVALRAGATGYISKDISVTELIDAVRRLAAGERYVAVPEEYCSVESIQKAEDAAPHHMLSPREHEIMVLIVNGMSLTEIGKMLFLSVHTVSTYRRRVLAKLDLTSNAELVRYAMLNRIVP